MQAQSLGAKRSSRFNRSDTAELLFFPAIIRKLTRKVWSEMECDRRTPLGGRSCGVGRVNVGFRLLAVQDERALVMLRSISLVVAK
jgi:hypothetical protein